MLGEETWGALDIPVSKGVQWGVIFNQLLPKWLCYKKNQPGWDMMLLENNHLQYVRHNGILQSVLILTYQMTHGMCFRAPYCRSLFCVTNASEIWQPYWRQHIKTYCLERAAMMAMHRLIWYTTVWGEKIWIMMEKQVAKLKKRGQGSHFFLTPLPHLPLLLAGCWSWWCICCLTAHRDCYQPKPVCGGKLNTHTFFSYHQPS